MFRNLYKFVLLIIMIIVISYLVGLTFMELFEKKLNEQFEIRNFNTKTDINNLQKRIIIFKII